jgi:hypothetical protein
LNNRTLVLLVVALTCLLVGLGLGQVVSAGATASPDAAALRQVNKSLTEIDSNLGQINTHIGSQFTTGTLYDEVEAIRSNTGKICNAVGEIACKTFTP